MLRNQEILCELSSVAKREDVDSISDEELRGAIAFYLCLHFDDKSYTEAEILFDFLPNKLNSKFSNP